VRIRGVETKDLDACYAISLATGLAGGDASSLYRDGRLMGHIYIAPYALLEPELTFVVEDHEGVAGFVTGTPDTTAWEARLEQVWWPALRKNYADPAHLSPEARTPDQRRMYMIHHPARTPSAVVSTYRGHLHMNLLPRLQRRGIGSKLFAVWHAAAAAKGASALHVGVNRENRNAIPFWQSLGFTELTLAGVPEGRTVWMGRKA
jgi:GNAT superfamily N-acetyltransferase